MKMVHFDAFFCGVGVKIRLPISPIQKRLRFHALITSFWQVALLLSFFDVYFHLFDPYVKLLQTNDFSSLFTII
jgi:hypothetical protein